MSEQRGAVIGLDLGGTKLMAGLFNGNDDLVAKEYVPVSSLSQDILLETLATTVLELAAKSDEPVVGAGYGIPTTIDQERGIAVVACNLPIKDLPVRDEMERRTGIASFIDNDANVAALAEQRLGVGRGVSDLIMLTLGTGFGGGIIIDGKLFNGSQGAAAELGHMSIDQGGRPCTAPNCPGIGCIEAYCSGSALRVDLKEFIAANPDSMLAEEVAAGAPIAGETIVKLAREGDADAIELFANTGRYLGVAMANFVNIFNPEMFVVGGGLSVAREWVLPPAIDWVRTHSLAPGNEFVRVEAAQFGAEAGMIGGAMLARDGLAARVAQAVPAGS